MRANMRGGLRGLRWPRESPYSVACVILILIAAALRFHDLPSHHLTPDEAVAALNAQGSFGELIENTRTRNSSPLLWPLGLWLIEKIEVSRLSIRLAPALASTLTVAALVVLLPLAGVRRSVAFPAGVLMAVSAAAIHEARDAREYSIEALLVVIMIAGALWYLRGEKRWLLPATLFVGPLLQYGMALLGAAVVLMIVVKQCLDAGWGRGRWMAGIRDTVASSIAPVLALSAGSVTAWFSTLQYHTAGWRAGWARDNYLQDDYYQGRLTNVGEIIQFIYEKSTELLQYHIDIIPMGVLAVVGILSFVLSKHVRKSNLTLLFLMCMIVALIAAILQQYPIGSRNQSLLWGPVIVVALSQCIPAVSELLDRLAFFDDIPANTFLFSVVVFSIISIGILAIISGTDRFFEEPRESDIAISIIEEQRNDGEIIIWSEEDVLLEFFYEGTFPEFVEFCDPMPCIDVLLNLQYSGNLWLGGSRLEVKDILLSDKLISIINDENLIETKVSSRNYSLYFLRNFETFIDNYKNLAEIFPGILDSLRAPVLKREEYDVYRSENSLLYVTSDCAEERPEFFIHVFPDSLDDLPSQWQELDMEFESRAFFFNENSITIGGQCIAFQSLPEYPFSHIVTGQFTDNEKIWYGAIDFSRERSSAEISREFLDTLGLPVLSNSGWDVYLSDQDILYVSDDACEFSVHAHPFFLHIYPVDVGDLPVEVQPHGFENRDFHSPHYANALDGGCVVVRSLPAYPVARMETGRYHSETGEKIWKGVIEGELLE